VKWIGKRRFVCEKVLIRKWTSSKLESDYVT